MLRFAMVVALVGLGACVLVATWIADMNPLSLVPAVYYTLFVSIFFSFVPAVWAHPARTISGSNIRVGLGPVLRTASPWAVALAAVCWLTLFALWYVSYPGDEFEITAKTLAGRPDRQRILVAFFATFHSTAALIASSGVRFLP